MGSKVFVCGPNFQPGLKDDVNEVRIAGLVLMMASRQKSIGLSFEIFLILLTDDIGNL